METFAHLSCADAKKLIAERQPNVVDIRDEKSFSQGHIPGAVNVDNSGIADFLQEADPDAPLIVCCYHGISSQAASQYFIEKDFDEVYSLDGGFAEWSQLYPTDCEKSA